MKNNFRIEGVVAIINYDGKILLGKKRSDSKKFLAGKWHIPGESLERGESDKSALIRLMREEFSSSLVPGRFLGRSYSPAGGALRWYECFTNIDEVYPGSDLEDAKWVPKNDVLKECDPKIIHFWPKHILEYFKD